MCQNSLLYSQWSIILVGVPQGATLGPLLLLIFINDITENIESNIKLFADDTSLSTPLSDFMNGK